MPRTLPQPVPISVTYRTGDRMDFGVWLPRAEGTLGSFEAGTMSSPRLHLLPAPDARRAVGCGGVCGGRGARLLTRVSSCFPQTCCAPVSVWKGTASSTPAAGPRKSQVRGPATRHTGPAAPLAGPGRDAPGLGVALPALLPLGRGYRRFCKWERMKLSYSFPGKLAIRRLKNVLGLVQVRNLATDILDFSPPT